jgi:hypothetical protein
METLDNGICPNNKNIFLFLKLKINIITSGKQFYVSFYIPYLSYIAINSIKFVFAKLLYKDVCQCVCSLTQFSDFEISTQNSTHHPHMSQWVSLDV